jgi:hypothetical protein
MADVKLRAKHKWALLTLMAFDGTMSNPEMQERAGFTLVNPERKVLNDEKLVTSRMAGRAYTHELTEAGWQWCEAELLGERPDRSGSAGGAMYAVLGLLRRYLDRGDLSLVEFCQVAASKADGESTADIDDRIRQAYGELAARPEEWVRLADLRPLLGSPKKADVDDALRRMEREAQVHIVPSSDQQNLTRADHLAAVRIGGEDNHRISIGDA